MTLLCAGMCVRCLLCIFGHSSGCLCQCVCLDTVCALLQRVCITRMCERVSAHRGCGISTQNHVRAVTSRAEIGLVSPVIRRRGERGKRRKLEERKRLFHHYYLPLHLHLHNNFISNSKHWMHNRTAMPLWSQLKLMEYLYADCGTLNFLSFHLNSSHPPLPCSYLSF